MPSEDVKEWPRQLREHIQGSGILGECLKNRLTQYRTSLKAAFQFKCLFQVAGFRILGWESEYMYSSCSDEWEISQTLPGDGFLLPSLLTSPWQSCLFVPDNWDAAGSIISWVPSLLPCLKPSSRGKSESLPGGSRIFCIISSYLLLSLVLTPNHTTAHIHQVWSCFLNFCVC